MDICSNDRECFLKALFFCGGNEIKSKLDNEITMIIRAILREQAEGVNFYDRELMRELKNPKDIFKAMINERLDIEPPGNKMDEYVTMYDGIRKIIWI